MYTTTANAHASVAESLVPYLEDEQIVLISPGYWGALEFQECFKRNNLNRKVLVGETESLIYTCRSTAPGFVNIRKIKEELEFAAFPATGAKTIKERLKSVYPQLIPVDSVIRTTLNNVNPLFHVPILLLNAGRIESKGDFFFYPEGGTPSVVNLIEQIDQERLALGEALNIKLSTTLELLKRFYKVDADNLYDGFQ